MGHITLHFLITHNAHTVYIYICVCGCVCACVIGSLDSTEQTYSTKAQAGRSPPQETPPSSTQRLTGRFVWHIPAADPPRRSFGVGLKFCLCFSVRAAYESLRRNFIHCESSVTKTDSLNNSQSRPLKAEMNQNVLLKSWLILAVGLFFRFFI